MHLFGTGVLETWACIKISWRSYWNSCWAPTQSFWVGLIWNLRICISNTFLSDNDAVGARTMPGQAVLQASLWILDLPIKLNGPMKENTFTVSFQDHLTLSGNSIQLKMQKTRGHCPQPLCITTYQQEVKLIYKHLLWVFILPGVWEKVPAARAEGNHPNSSVQWCEDKC